MTKLKIVTTVVQNDFAEHLKIPNNSNILFSAPFGTGKTTFLDDFFTSNSERYNYIHIFPVYYSVAQNEDIFELIKYDILFDLLLKFKPQITSFQDLNFSKSLALQLYLVNDFKALSFFQKLASTTSKIGKQVSDIINLIKDENQTFQEYYKSANRNEEEIINDFVVQFEATTGNIHEFDTISQLIYNILEKLKSHYPGDKGEERKKENVLIIDDLDRIDPEHIFRIFNVFSAHQDWHTKKNKFGFDKVILVCDIENIRQIYQYRYGPGVDFTGYINKFYSTGVYSFNIQELIVRTLNDILSPLCTISGQSLSSDSPLKRYDLKYSSGHKFVEYIMYALKAFLLANLLDLRSILNMEKFKIRDYNFYDENNKGRYNSAIRYEFLVLIQFFEQLFGNLRSFENKLHLLATASNANPKNLGFENSYYQDSWGGNLVEYCLQFYNKADKKKAATEKVKVELIYREYIIHYDIGQHYREYYYSFKQLTDTAGNIIPLEDLNLFLLMKDTLDIVKRSNIMP